MEKMKKIIFPLAMATAMLSLNSCSSDDDAASVSKYISVTTEINQTRVVTDENGTQTFAENDKISVYAWTGSANTPAKGNDRVVDNAINVRTATAWTCTPEMRWKNTVDAHYFVGVYPANEASVADLTAADYAFDVTDQEKSDLLVATNLTGVKTSNNPVLLAFDHMMAKVYVNLSYKNEFGGIPTVSSVTFNDVAVEAKVNYVTKTVTASAKTADVALPVLKANEQYASVIIPQTGATKITIVVNGKSYVYTHSEDFKLASGKTTVINLTVGRDELTVNGVTVNGWDKGTEIAGGEAEK